MEGYIKVFIKRSFSLSTFEKYWAVLDIQTLTFYQHIDVENDAVGPFKLAVSVKGCTVVKLRPKENGTNHGLKIIGESSSAAPIALLDCEDSNSCNTWFLSLTKAVSLHADNDDRKANMAKYLKSLGLDVSKTDISRELITKSYKRLALQHHPDKGGDVSIFNEINVAYNNMLAIQSAEDERRASTPIDYEVVIKKGGDGIGLGIIVLEDKVKRQIVVQSVQENIIIEGITFESGGSIMPGDILIGIGKDDCSHWLLSRVKARLNNFRVPVGSSIRLAFERRIPKQFVEDEVPVSTNSHQPTSNRPVVSGASNTASSPEFAATSIPVPAPSSPVNAPGPVLTPARIVSPTPASNSPMSSAQYNANQHPASISSSFPVVSPTHDRSSRVPTAPSSVEKAQIGSNSIDEKSGYYYREEYLAVSESYNVLRSQFDGLSMELAMLQRELDRKNKEVSDCKSELERVRSHCDRQLVVSFQAVDAARNEASEMKERTTALIGILHDRVPTLDESDGGRTDIVAQNRRLSEQLVESELKLAAATRKIREQAQLIAQLRTGLAGQPLGSEKESSSFVTASLSKKLNKYSNREHKAQSLVASLGSLLNELQCAVSD